MIKISPRGAKRALYNLIAAMLVLQGAWVGLLVGVVVTSPELTTIDVWACGDSLCSV
jgi:hypothetical protein